MKSSMSYAMADFNLATHRGKPQRGHAEISFREQTYLIKIGATPTPYGDKLTLKIADRAAAMRGLNKLGFTPEVQARLEELAQQPSGLLLFSGGRGEDRSTTQYALLNKLNSIEKSLLTIEPYSSYRLSSQSYLSRRFRCSGLCPGRALGRRPPSEAVQGL